MISDDPPGLKASSGMLHPFLKGKQIFQF
jgi:hypothetical protein